MTYLSLTQVETRHRLIQAELEREHAKAAGRRVVPLPQRRNRRLGLLRDAAAKLRPPCGSAPGSL